MKGLLANKQSKNRQLFKVWKQKELYLRKKPISKKIFFKTISWKQGNQEERGKEIQEREKKINIELVK